MELDGLEETLQRLPEIGTPVKLRPYRQVWRFTLTGTPPRSLYLKFFPRAGSELKRFARLGNSAHLEYERLVWLQKANIRAPRAAAYLAGLLLSDQKGDAVLTHALEPSETLDAWAFAKLRAGQLHDAAHRAAVAEVITLLESLVRAGLGHTDLHLGNFLRHAGHLYLLDAFAVTKRPLSVSDLHVLAYAARPYTTRTDLLRAWRKLTGSTDRPPALATPVAVRAWRKSVERMTTPSEYVDATAFTAGTHQWSGLTFRRWKFPPSFSRAAALTIDPADWQRELPRLWAQVEAGTLYPLKLGRSGDVWAGEMVLAGVPVEVVVKRARRRYAYRYLTELGRGTRTWRAWTKSWMLIARGIPAAWPLAMMQRTVAGIAVDQFIVFERVPGKSLDHLADLGLTPDARTDLLRRTGRLLKTIENTRLVHFDTKPSNIMVWLGEEGTGGGAHPVLVDVDGVRNYTWRGEGLRRLLEGLTEQGLPPADLAAVNAGYAPFARTAVAK